MDFDKVHLLYANYYESGFICEKCTYRNNHRNGVYLSYRPNETFLERAIHKSGDKTFGRSTVKSIQNPDKSADKLAFYQRQNGLKHLRSKTTSYVNELWI